jgi:hypothetical protein
VRASTERAEDLRDALAALRTEHDTALGSISRLEALCDARARRVRAGDEDAAALRAELEQAVTQVAVAQRETRAKDTALATALKTCSADVTAATEALVRQQREGDARHAIDIARLEERHAAQVEELRSDSASEIAALGAAHARATAQVRGGRGVFFFFFHHAHICSLIFFSFSPITSPAENRARGCDQNGTCFSLFSFFFVFFGFLFLFFP